MRLAYFSPSGQRSGRVEISMGGMPTPDAGELHLTAAIPFIDKATLRASPTGVAWINEHHKDTRTLGLVRDKLPQLAEAPAVVLAALAFANRRPGADVCQVFQHKRSLRVFGMRHKRFGNRMIHPATEAAFLPGQLLQAPLGGFRASG